MRVLSLASGSSGNCYFVSAANTNILVDCGISARSAIERLAENGVDTKKIDALLITHEHSDHIGGAYTLTKRLGIPAFMSFRTYTEVSKHRQVEEVSFFHSGRPFEKGNLKILPFPVSHDAVDPVGFRIFSDEGDIVLATDTGKVTDEIRQVVDGARVLVLESNHDEHMLKYGPYPEYLKARIASEVGHLSNKTSGALLREMNRCNLEALLLSHLSRANNLPKIVLEEAKEAFSGDFGKTVVQVGDQFIVRDFTL